ncbi:hypothetical protein HDU67_001356 [Dinochytrium kinnereticum]|nr:hypothetical protein HDU67_001356 [Dinochytrium kinnereticum]
MIAPLALIAITAPLIVSAQSSSSSSTAAATSATTTAAAPAPSLSCSPFLASDTYCGFLAPAQSVFKVEEAAGLVKNYVPLLSAICPDVKQVADILPVVFCMGALGPCNGAKFSLPAVDASGTPTNLTEVGVFYNTAKFAEVVPALRSQNILPPCYETCNRAAKSIIACPSLRTILNSTADPCEGLPTTNCASTIGPKAGGGSLTTSTAPATTTTTSKPSGADGKVTGAVGWVVAGLVGVFAAAL